MLKINLSRIFQLRGISTPYTFLLKHGISAPTARMWARDQIGSMKPSHFEAICTALNCTPNDLFEWHPDGKSVLPESHALRTLSRPTTATSIREMIHEIPLEKVQELSAMVEELKKTS
jgi:DNA-binding Xre family transcriptional regulator